MSIYNMCSIQILKGEDSREGGEDSPYVKNPAHTMVTVVTVITGLSAKIVAKVEPALKIGLVTCLWLQHTRQTVVSRS